MHDFIIITSVIVLAWLAVRVLRAAFGAIGQGRLHFTGFYRDWADPTFKLARALVVALAAIVVVHYLPGAESRAFEGIAIFAGVLLSVGSSGAIGNIVAGTVLTYTRAFQVGDRIRIGETYGDVVERTLLVTRVRTIKNEVISLPNGSVLGKQITNYSTAAEAPGLILHTAVTLGYDVPWRTVHGLLVEAALSTPHVQATPAPFVLQLQLEDFYVRYQLNAYTDEPNTQARTYSALHQNIQDKLHGAGIEMLSPHYLAFREGQTPVMPRPSGARVEAVVA